MEIRTKSKAWAVYVKDWYGRYIFHSAHSERDCAEMMNVHVPGSIIREVEIKLIQETNDV